MRATEVMGDLLACLVFRNSGGFEMQQSQFMKAAGEVMVDEISEMRAEIKRINDIAANNDAKSELAVLKIQFEDFREEMRHLLQSKSEKTREQSEREKTREQPTREKPTQKARESKKA